MPGTETITETFTSAVNGSEESYISQKRYNVTIGGTFVATIQLQRSFDRGTTWSTVKEVTAAYDGVGIEPEPGVLYRFACTAFTSGSAVCRLGQGRR